MLPVQIVKRSGERSQSVRTEGQDHFRCHEGISLFQRPAEAVRMNAHDDPGLVSLIGLRLRQKVSAVHEGHTTAVSPVFSGIRVTEDHKGVGLMAGGAPRTAGGQPSMGDTGPLYIALHGMSSMEGDQVHISVRQVYTAGQCPQETNGRFSPVLYPAGSCDYIRLFQNPIIQDYLQF